MDLERPKAERAALHNLVHILVVFNKHLEIKHLNNVLRCGNRGISGIIDSGQLNYWKIMHIRDANMMRRDTYYTLFLWKGNFSICTICAYLTGSILNKFAKLHIFIMLGKSNNIQLNIITYQKQMWKIKTLTSSFAHVSHRKHAKNLSFTMKNNRIDKKRKRWVKETLPTKRNK